MESAGESATLGVTMKHLSPKVSQLLYLAGVGIPVFVAHVGLSAGVPGWLVVTGLAIAVGLVALLLQRAWPYRASWRAWGREVGVDVLHALLSTGAAVHVFQALTLGLFYAASAWLTEMVGARLWWEGPVWVQLLIALIIGDLGYYWVHRLAHTVPLFWRFHALHHSSECLHVLASGRTHPLNAIAVYAGQFLPLVLLGVPAHVLALLAVFTSAHGMLQHANARFCLGWVNWVFAGPELHRWHHSTLWEASRTNYGSNLILWDLVFRTRFLPSGRAPLEVGLPGSDFRRNFFRHLLSPFRYRVVVMSSDDAEVAARDVP